MNGYIYRIYIPKHGAFYIGQHNGNKANYWGSGKVMMAIIRKYGTGDLVKDILYEAKTQDELDDAEIYFIRVHRDFGFKLFNILPGGRGVSGYKRPSWVCRKISLGQKGKPKLKYRSAEASRAAGDKNRGRKRTPEQIARIAAGCIGRRASDEAKANMRKARPGRHFSPLTPEHRAKIAESNRVTKALNKQKRLAALGQSTLAI